MAKGIVYILTNRAMPGWVKIGRCEPHLLDQRIRQLSNTSVPFAFECEYAALVENASEVEARVHRLLGSIRRNPKREFFEMPAEVAKEALLLTPHDDVSPGTDFTADEADKEALEEAREREIKEDAIDCLIIVASKEAPDGSAGFEDVFLQQQAWWEFRMAEPYRKAVKWIAGYQIRPIQKVTHIAEVARFEPSPKTEGRWKAVFARPAEALARPIPLGDDAPNGLMQGPRYCNRARLLEAASLTELLTR